MKEFIEKWLLYAVPLLLIISICYNNGYWSVYDINIYDYYQASDILKVIALPGFKFISLAFIPLSLGTIILLIGNNKEENTKHTNELSNNIKTYESLSDKSKEIDEAKENAIKKVNKITFKNLIIDLFKMMFLFSLITLIVLLTIYFLLDYSFYNEQNEFTKIYLSGVEISETITACIVIPITIGLLLKLVSYFQPKGINIPVFRISAFISSLLLTFALSYYSGKIDSSKILSGYDFYYTVSRDGTVNKYLGKLDKYFFFLEDNRVIDYKAPIPLRVDTMSYGSRILIISEDSLKHILLSRHDSHTVISSPSKYYKIFQVRNSLKTKKM